MIDVQSTHTYENLTVFLFPAWLSVIECVPAVVAKAVTEAVKIPVIGIGAGPFTTGQVLVYHDLLGIDHHPHFEKHIPAFCKRYIKMGGEIHKALVAYRTEVLDGSFPTEEYSPYKMSEAETAKFEQLMELDAAKRLKEGEQVYKKLREADEYEVTKLY